MAKKKGGNPRNRSGSGRVTTKPAPPCRPRSIHYGNNRPCKFSSSMKVGDGPRVKQCSWCGKSSPGSPKIVAAKGPEPEEVPDSWFSTEEPVIALSIPEWQALRRRGEQIQRRYANE